MQNALVKMEAGLTSVEVSSLGRPAETDCTPTTSTPPTTTCYYSYYYYYSMIIWN